VGTIEHVRPGGIDRDDARALRSVEKHRTKFKVPINDPILYLYSFCERPKASIGIGFFRIKPTLELSTMWLQRADYEGLVTTPPCFPWAAYGFPNCMTWPMNSTSTGNGSLSCFFIDMILQHLYFIRLYCSQYGRYLGPRKLISKDSWLTSSLNLLD